MDADVQKPTIVVTGASGLLGSGVVKRFAGPYHVMAMDVVPPKEALPAEAEHIECDLTSQTSVEQAFAQVRERRGEVLASVIHLAAYVDFSGEPSDKYEQVTVRGTERLLDELSAFRVEQFLFSSTMLIHPPTEPGKPIHEDSPLESTWLYPESKIKTEKLIRAKRGEIPVVMLRLAGVYDDVCHSLTLAHQIQRIYEKQMTAWVFPGEVTHGQSLVHYDDAVEAFWLAVERRHALPAELPLLIGEPEPVSYEQLQRTFSRLIHGEERETRRVPKAMARAGAWMQLKMASEGEEPFIKPWMIDRADDHYELDISRARAAIGWEPQHSLRETLPKMVEALKRDPVGWYKEHELPLPDELREKKAG